jgi:hypothetical protein
MIRFYFNLNLQCNSSANGAIYIIKGQSGAQDCIYQKFKLKIISSPCQFGRARIVLFDYP